LRYFVSFEMEIDQN